MLLKSKNFWFKGPNIDVSPYPVRTYDDQSRTKPNPIFVLSGLAKQREAVFPLFWPLFCLLGQTIALKGQKS
jgi:hypothetical protein